VKEFKQQGYTIIQIKNHLGLSYSQVAGFFNPSNNRPLAVPGS
jgi:hypothetical protein